MLDVRRLQILLAVVENGSVTAAAHTLSYTPSAVSQQLLQLERDVGQPLMLRHARGMSPTDAGQVLAGHARRVLRQLAAAESDLQDVRHGQILLGTFASVASSFLPLAVSRFRQLHPAMRLDILGHRQNRLVELLENGTVDLSLLTDYSWNRLDPSQFRLTELVDDPTVLVVPTNHPLARRHEVSMSELADDRWISRRDHPIAEVLRRGALAAGFEPEISLRVTDYQQAQAMVGVGLGVTIAPRTAVINRLPSVRVISLGDTVAARRILLAQRPGDLVHPPTQTAFLEVLADIASLWTAASTSKGTSKGSVVFEDHAHSNAFFRTPPTVHQATADHN
jgi:DNA-binding transcriptional LysR family regulator